jgi:hypothetical protein
VRAEQDNSVRLKALGNLASKAADNMHGHLGATISPHW